MALKAQRVSCAVGKQGCALGRVPAVARGSLAVSCALRSDCVGNSRHARRTDVRVLRYPNGDVRTIRYPAADVEEEFVDLDDQATHGGWDLQTGWNAFSLTAAAVQPTQTDASDAAQRRLHVDRLLASLFGNSAISLPETPRIQFEILDGCPWPLPRPMYVFARTSAASDDSNSMYTLRTRVETEDMSDELSKVIGGRKTPGWFTASHLTDGVVAFDCAEDAHQYLGYLELDGLQVTMSEVDSHRLFRTAVEAKAVVVHVPRGAPVPRPHQLASAVKRQSSLDDF